MIVIMIDGSKKHTIVMATFELYSLHSFEKHSKMLLMELRKRNP